MYNTYLTKRTIANLLAIMSISTSLTAAGHWEVSTIAGLAGNIGNEDGPGNAARFTYPMDITADSAGNLYVLDNDDTNRLTHIRKLTYNSGLGKYEQTITERSGISPAGAAGITIDSTGNLYVTYAYDRVIRKLTYDTTLGTYTVSTIAGKAGGGILDGENVDGSGDTARFFRPYGITADSADNLYVMDFSAIRKLTYDATLGTYEVRTILGDREKKL